MKLEVSKGVCAYLKDLTDKDRRVIGEHISRLSGHPNAAGDIKRLRTRKNRWRMHIGSKYVLFYFVDGDTVKIDRIMTQEQAHKKYGKI